MVSIYLLLSVLLVLSIIVLYAFGVLQTPIKVTETFVEEEVVYEVNDNDYVLHTDHPFNDQCVNSFIKPDDVKSTNIVEFLNMKDVKFIGISTDKRHYMVISKLQDVPNIHSIEDNTKIGYAYERDKVLFDRLFKKAYHKSMRFENINREPKEYVSDYCNSYDNTNNMFIDFMESEYDYFVFSLDTHYDEKLYGYFNDFFIKRVKLLDFVGDLKINPFIKHKIHDYIFMSVIKDKYIEVDNVLCQSNDIETDFNRLFTNNLIDFDASQHYIDVYHCDVPDEMLKHFKQDHSITKVKIDDLKNTPDSCKADTKIKNLDNSPKNIFGRHVYKSTRCSESYKNLFIDIIYPFASTYDMKLSPDDFNTLKIHSDKFDDYIPIRNAFSYNNFNISRYKINVDPERFPTESYIDDIYYGAYKDDDDKTILTNSIPFDLNESLHTIEYQKSDDVIIDVIISFNNEGPPAATYTHKGESMSVHIFEGDRLYINPDSIYDINLSNFIESKLRDGKNFNYGFVTTTVEGGGISRIVIRLDDIREASNFKRIEGKCFNSNMDELVEIQDEIECLQDKDNIWEFGCKYNYECPYFQSNSNYLNHFGGCEMNGFCQMPRGIHKQTFKQPFIDKDNQPLCYNCDPESENCCDDYKKNELLVSPDYMFKNDQEQRIKHLFSMKSDDEEGDASKSKCGLYINKY
jgi:hypothetical protein